MDKNIVELNDKVIEYIIENHTNDEKGVRTLKKSLHLIYSKLNVIILTEGSNIFNYNIDVSKKPIKLTNDIIDMLLDEFKNNDNKDKEYLKNSLYL